MYNIPIFDSATHPTFNGKWINNIKSTSLEQLENEMTYTNIQWALAYGIEGIGDYSEETYANMVLNSNKNIYPIAFLNKSLLSSHFKSEDWISKIKTLGYVGLKIHPRFSDISLDCNRLPYIIKIAGEAGLVVVICTYFYSNNLCSLNNNLFKLVELIRKTKDTKIILLHGGTTNLLEMSEICRVFPNTLLDLSFTMCKYEGSSLDLDISYLYKFFDRRICIGSDNPDFKLLNLRERFEFFAQGLTEDKAKNIAYRNLMDFMEDLI